jgi:hypothetical protein
MRRAAPASRGVRGGWARCASMMVVIGLALLAGPARAQEAGRSDSALVTYVSGRSIYVDAGARDGLRQGSRLEVHREGRLIAVLRVVYLSPGRASAEAADGGEMVEVGDVARFVALVEPRASDSTAQAGIVQASVRPRRPLAQRARGRIAVRYLSMLQRDSGHASLAQPAADVRIDAPALLGSRLGLAVDVRGRRTVARRLDGTSESTSASRVYHLSTSWNARGDGLRLTAGRQFSEALSNVSLFDGVRAEVHQARWGAGAFGGTQPDPMNLGLSGAIREYGAFVQMRSPAASPRRWSLTSGAIGSYAKGEVNREFAFVQASYLDRTVAVFAVQEVDLNRGWKTEAGESTVAPTSAFLSVRVRPSETVAIHAGADSRRSVRLYRDRETPETDFDDRVRRGAWGGLAVRFGRHLQVGADVRMSDGPIGRGDAYTVSLGTDRFGWSALAGRARSTVYSSPRTTGRLHAVTFGANPLPALHVEMHGGLRDERSRPGVSNSSSTGKTRVWWFGADADVTLATSWYLLLAASRETGGWESADLFHGGLSFRF